MSWQSLSYKATVDGNRTADGRTEGLPSAVRAATVWGRNGEKRQVVFHGENPIVDAAASPAAGRSGEPTKADTAAAKAGEVAAP